MGHAYSWLFWLGIRDPTEKTAIAKMGSMRIAAIKLRGALLQIDTTFNYLQPNWFSKIYQPKFSSRSVLDSIIEIVT